ncbi:hypothetical protein PCASD_07675 [Puccinia coronata f. sp. avenae]|uniref:HAT C-terminal dimerisation domain-containing protein n=1 Tax=Puccinia coronata f. sp. avenae TaxID=200324 RepID=A0A2N5UP47_9BASI|nr:hypothetical protein PCASD_07675 [Puccinia coronata f. sp. avenae]
MEVYSDDSELLDEADFEASDEEDGNCYTSKSCQQTLAKFREISKKLRFSPNSKAKFLALCRENKCAKPHMVERNERTQWNSTSAQLKSIVRCKSAILEWQRHRQFGMDSKYCVNQSEFSLARNLVDVLEIFHKVTLQVSNAGSALLANVVVFIDQITNHLLTIISNKDYPPALRNACRAGLKMTNKYYSLTDASPLYRITILLHPSFRNEYFKLANWEPEWITKAICLVQEMWVLHYKPRPVSTPSQSASATPTPSARPVTGMLAGLSSAAAARGGNASLDAFDIWLTGALILDGNEPVNPLKWWIQQKRTGNTHGGLVHMALDVLGCPATTVDVERSFSFGRDYVATKRHRLAPYH